MNRKDEVYIDPLYRVAEPNLGRQDFLLLRKESQRQGKHHQDNGKLEQAFSYCRYETQSKNGVI